MRIMIQNSAMTQGNRPKARNAQVERRSRTRRAVSEVRVLNRCICEVLIAGDDMDTT